MAAVAAQVFDRKQRAGGLQTISPFHQHRPLVKELVEAEILQLRANLEPIQVYMRDLERSCVNPHELKGRARDVRGRSRAACDSPDECGLAGAKVTREEDKIALPQLPAKFLAGGLGLSRGAGDRVKQSDRSRSPVAPADARRHQRL